MYHSSHIPDLVGHSIDQGRLKLVDTLGSGSNGVIFLAEDTHSGSCPTQYAVKCVVRAEKGSRRYILQRQEIQFHRQLSHHPNVVTLHKVIEEKYYVFLVLDYIRGGDLFNFLQHRRDYRGDDAYVKRLFLQIIDALAACHAAGIYHRDLKPENILISEDAQQVYLTDFGLATPNAQSKTFGAGSSLYMSPECIGTQPSRPAYSPRANDIWALGVILTSIISGHNPWNHACPTDACYRAYLRNDRFLIEMLPISPSANLLLQHIFRRESIRRITLTQIRDVVEAMDSFFMRPALIAGGGEYLRSSAATYFEGSPFAAHFVPAASPATSLVLMEEGNAEGHHAPATGSRDAPSSDESDTTTPHTPQSSAQQPQLDVADASQAPYTLDLQGAMSSLKRRRSMSPGGILRRFVDRFFTE
ncbi:kinase-like protein [Trametes coccinea BRFM310]|uniref:Kinase-like protein n=1 Tax=Trametes coccinea (strain BRFM310) TaxID=1353009 RepID=A0A1Y2J780_TRAC3|nr:kinase-like protein [Trametes coccinea BRFM310]